MGSSRGKEEGEVVEERRRGICIGMEGREVVWCDEY